MRWITGGPDLPPELLQALEDGKLVFFCGAGVSYPAGLPTFRGLVEEVYKRLGEPLEGIEQLEFNKQNYDRVLGLLERRLEAFVRKKIIEVLHLEPDANLSSHKALLTLATSKDGVCRLVTTNFDRGFEFASSGEIAIDSAPKLSVPKLGVWNSIIHLHGIISDKDPEGRSLVLTSADFGTAYLTERWASRCISDLFRRFTVLFVGYSVEDPVIRYMMDAFAADRVLGEGVGRAYVFAGTTDANRKSNMDTWRAKGVIPILYEDVDHHKALHVTLSKWADCHRGGLFGKESIIREHCSSHRPTKPYSDDPVVSQVLWAISEPTGHNAQVFAHLDSIPSIEWLDVFDQNRLLSLTNIAGLPCSLVDAGQRTSNPEALHPVPGALAEWITHHLSDIDLLNWVLRSGCSLHPEFRDAIRRRLKVVNPVQYGLSQIWQLLTLEPPCISLNAYHPVGLLCDQLSAGIWNLQTKYELVAALAPELELRPSLMRTIYPELPVDGKRTSSYAESEVVVHSRAYENLVRQAIEQSPNHHSILAEMADDLTSLLRRAMELFEMVQKADAKFDSSYSDQPSISPHAQNSALRGWTVLIELLRDAWKELLLSDRDRARRSVERWRTIPYPLFRRLCFYAMAESDFYSPEECLEYLLEDDSWWLWSNYVYHDKFRLLHSLWPKLSGGKITRLTSAITAGPPRAMFREDTEEEHLRLLSDHSIWLLLAKLRNWGFDLPAPSSEALRDLSAQHPEWELAEGDRNEFPIWMTEGIGERVIENEDEFLNAPDDTLLQRLLTPGSDRQSDLRKWQRVVEKQPSRASEMLTAMAGEGQWPQDIWEPLLQGFSAVKLSASEWPRFVGALRTAPKSVYEILARPIAWLLHDVASILPNEADEEFWEVWDQVQPYAFQDDDRELSQDPITAAINIPAGHLTQAILDRAGIVHARTAEIGQLIWARLTMIADGPNHNHTYARVLLASRLAWLHTLDSEWVERHLLKYFKWPDNPESSSVWQGYLWQARMTPELWNILKTDFLLAFHDKQKLGDFEDQIATVFGYLCIDQPEWFSTEEVRSALRLTDAKGRAAISRVIFRRLQGAGENSEALWRTLISPWLDKHWPKQHALVDPISAGNFALAAAHAGGAFPSAVGQVEPFLTGCEDYSHIVDYLQGTDHPDRSPVEVLQLLKIVDTNWMWPDRDLRELLIRLQKAQPTLADDPKFRRLDEYLRRNGL